MSARLFGVRALTAAGLPPTQARQFGEPLRAACEHFGITTPARLGGFLAQCRVESVDFTRLEENLRYRSAERLRAVYPSRVQNLHAAATLIAAGPQAIGTAVYAGRLGNVEPDDGWRYRGRGIIQLTGRTNYTDAAAELGRPYVEQPDLVAQPADACLTAAWYWWTHKCSLLADSAQWDAITRAINGPGMLEAEMRRQWCEEAVQALAAIAAEEGQA